MSWRVPTPSSPTLFAKPQRRISNFWTRRWRMMSQLLTSTCASVLLSDVWQEREDSKYLSAMGGPHKRWSSVRVASEETTKINTQKMIGRSRHVLCLNDDKQQIPTSHFYTLNKI